MAKRQFTDADLEQFVRWYKATYGKTFANRYDAEAALRRELGGGKQRSSGGSGSMAPRVGPFPGKVMWSTGTLAPKPRNVSQGGRTTTGYADFLENQQKRMKEAEKEQKRQAREDAKYQRNNARDEKRELKKRTHAILAMWDKFEGNPPEGYGESMDEKTAFGLALARAKSEKKQFDDAIGDSAMASRNVVPSGDGALDSPKKEKRKSPTYGKRPKSGWGRVVIEEGDDKGTELWTDPNGTMIKRTPIMTDENGDVQYEVQRKVEGGTWQKKGVMVGDNKNTFVSDKESPPVVPDETEPPALQIAHSQGNPYADLPKSPRRNLAPPVGRDHAPYEGRGFGDVGKLAQDVYRAGEDALGSLKDQWNRDWGKRELPSDEPNYEPPPLTEEEEQALLEMEEEEMLGKRRKWASAQGWGLAPGNYEFEEGGDYGWM